MSGNVNAVHLELKITLFAAQWCPKCQDIVKIMEKSGLEFKGILLNDSPEGLTRLVENISSTNLPAFSVDGNVLYGYFPRQLSILLKTTLEARNHPAHPLARTKDLK